MPAEDMGIVPSRGRGNLPGRGRDYLKRQLTDLLRQSPMSDIMGIDQDKLEALYQEIIGVLPPEEVEREVKALPVMKK